jgi:hypothetical protein
MLAATLMVGCHKVASTSKSVPYIDPRCPRIINGLFSFRGDLIHDQRAASDIGLIVVKQFNRANGIEAPTGVEVKELGSTWSVLGNCSPPPLEAASFELAGGGTAGG